MGFVAIFLYQLFLFKLQSKKIYNIIDMIIHIYYTYKKIERVKLGRAFLEFLA